MSMTDLFIQRKPPLTATAIISNIGIAAQALAGETAVDYFSEFSVFDYTNGLTWVEGHTLALSGSLDTAVDGGVCKGIAVDLDRIIVDVCIETELQRLCKAFYAGVII